MRHIRILWLAALLLGSFAAQAVDKTIHDFTADTAAATGDEFPFWDISASATKKITLANLKLSLTLVKADVGLGSVENTALSTWAGSTALVTVGTVGAGTWQGTAIGDGYIASAATWNAKGTVTSVSLSLPTAVFVSPVSGSGGTTAVSLAPALATQSANRVLAGPTTGSAATPTFRALVAADVPDLSGTYQVAGSYLAPGGDGSALTGLTQSQVSGLTVTSVPQFSNVRVTQSTLTYGASTALDFSGDGFRTVTVAGDITITSLNLAAGRSVTVRIVGDGSPRTLAFPAWKFVGAAAPSSLAAGKTGVLTVTSFGTTDANCVAAYAVEP